MFYAGKGIENRSWPLPLKYVGVPVLLHASKRLDAVAVKQLIADGFNVPPSLPLGGIVGITVFTGSTLNGGCGFWAQPDFHHWLMDAKRTLELPFFPCNGRLGFFMADYPYTLPEFAK